MQNMKSAKQELFRLLKDSSDSETVSRVQALLLLHPRLAEQPDPANSALALHKAVCYQQGAGGLAVVRLVLDSFPQAAMVPARGDWLPMHYAAANQAGPHGAAIVQLLAAAAPQALGARTAAGLTPLHVAAMHQKADQLSRPIVETLLRAAPHTALQACRQGQTPLMLAALSQGGRRGTAVVEALLLAADGREQGRERESDRQAALKLALSRTRMLAAPQLKLSKDDRLVALLRGLVAAESQSPTGETAGQYSGGGGRRERETGRGKE